MKNTFSITIKMTSADQLAAFINEVGPLVESITITTTPTERPTAQPAGKKPAEAKKAPQRVSKVNDTIMGAVQNGPVTVKQLKEALEAKHLSASSLSTGIASLTKDGRLTRVAEGIYGLPGSQQEAA